MTVRRNHTVWKTDRRLSAKLAIINAVYTTPEMSSQLQHTAIAERQVLQVMIRNTPLGNLRIIISRLLLPVLVGSFTGLAKKVDLFQTALVFIM